MGSCLLRLTRWAIAHYSGIALGSLHGHCNANCPRSGGGPFPGKTVAKPKPSPSINDDPKWRAAISAVMDREAEERAARLKAKRATKRESANG